MAKAPKLISNIENKNVVLLSTILGPLFVFFIFFAVKKPPNRLWNELFGRFCYSLETRMDSGPAFGVRSDGDIE